MKWFLAIVAVCLVVLFVRHERSAVKSSYVNGLPQYNQLPNREFIFQRDCYIFKDDAHPTDWPLVAAHATVPALPAEVTEKNVGTEISGLRLLDVVRTGARFRLVSVRRDESRQGTTITFEILFLDEASRKYARLDAFDLLDHAPEKNGAPPVFLGDYAAPLLAN